MDGNVLAVIAVIITLAALLLTTGGIYIGLNGKIDRVNENLGNKIDNGNQEIRNLINFAIRDFNSRIDNADKRIDRVYQAPSIKSS